MNNCLCGNPANANGTMCLRCTALNELGLKSGATDQEIRSAYLLHVKAWHPDRFPGDQQSKNAAQEKLKAINFAYRYLNFLSTDGQEHTSRPATGPTVPQEPDQGRQTPAGRPPRAATAPGEQPTAESKFTVVGRWAGRHWGYLLLLITLTIGVVGEFSATPSNQGPSSATPTEAVSPTVQPQNEGESATGAPSGLTPVSVDQNDVESASAVRLPNGTELRKRRHLNGLGELTIENGTTSDAVVHLVDLKTQKTIRTFYVLQGYTFTERQIAPGLYGIYFATGNWWNPELKQFNSAATYSQFGRNLEYSENHNAETGKVEYATYKITLQPVVGGDVTPYPSDKETFDKMMNDGSPE